METDFHTDTSKEAALLQFKALLPESKVQDTYFDALPDKIMQRLIFEVPESKLLRTIMISVAAVVMICITLASLRFHPHNQLTSEALTSGKFEEEYLWYQEDSFTEALYSDANGMLAPNIVQDEYGNVIEMIYEAD
jgi:hypothetical protein